MMNKRKFIDYCYKKCGKSVRKGVLTVCVDIILDALRDAILEEDVRFMSFGTFGLRHRKPTKCHNFKTGKKDSIVPEKYIPRFIPSEKLKEYVNERKQ